MVKSEKFYKEGDAMRRFALFSMLFLLVLSSCSWTLRGNPLIGKRYELRTTEGVVFYKEPSFNGEVLKLEGADEFVVEELVCSDGRFSCATDVLTGGIWGYPSTYFPLFYKVRFVSGGYGYISHSSLNYPSGAIISFDRIELNKRLGPQSYMADYNSVWQAALDSLDELGFVIAAMSKEDGYITTQMKGRDRVRDKVSINITGAEGSVNVKVSLYSEYFRQTGVKAWDGYWVETTSDGYMEVEIKELIASKLQAR